MEGGGIVLKPKQYRLIEIMLANPTATHKQLVEMAGIGKNTLTAWKRDEAFMAGYNRQLKEIWKDSEAIAVNTMIMLASEGDFRASKYILDSMNYAPTTKIEADINSDIILNIGEQ